MACIDVNCFRGSGSGPSGRWWQWASGFVDEARDVDTVIRESVVGIGGVIPFHMGELAEVCQIIKQKAGVGKKFGDVEMLWSVLCGKLGCMEIKPPCYLFLRRQLLEMWRRWLPRWVGAS